MKHAGKMGKQVAIGIGVFILALVGTGLVVAQRAGEPSRADELYDWLNLSSAQREAIEAADPAFWGESEALTERLTTGRAGLASMMVDQAASDQAIRTQLEEVIDAEVALERRVADFVLRLRALLDEGQRRRLMEMVASGLKERAGAHLRTPAATSGR